MVLRYTSQMILLAALVALTGCGDNRMAFEQSASSAGGRLTTPIGGNNPEATPPPKLCPTCPDPLRGTDGITQNEVENNVDILMVIDNSPSMDAVQTKLSVGFNNLVNSLQPLDWQIGFTSTDLGAQGGQLVTLQGASGTVLKRSTPDAANVFKNTLMGFGVAGSGDERGIYAANLALPNSSNSVLYRNNSALAVVFVSDEDERSTGGRSENHNGNISTGTIEHYDVPQTLIDTARNTFGAAKKFSTYGLIVRTNDYGCYTQADRSFYGTFYETMASLTGGRVGSICDTDYSATLQGIGQNIRSLMNSITLSHVPVADTVRVSITPYEAMTYTVSGNKVIFNHSPAPGSQINVTYYYYPGN